MCRYRCVRFDKILYSNLSLEARNERNTAVIFLSYRGRRTGCRGETKRLRKRALREKRFPNDEYIVCVVSRDLQIFSRVLSMFQLFKKKKRLARGKSRSPVFLHALIFLPITRNVFARWNLLSRYRAICEILFFYKSKTRAKNRERF